MTRLRRVGDGFEIVEPQAARRRYFAQRRVAERELPSLGLAGAAIGDPVMAREFVEALWPAVGVEIAPLPLVEDDLKAGRLIAPLGFIPSGQSYVALKRTQRSRKADLFIAWLRAELIEKPEAAASPSK